MEKATRDKEEEKGVPWWLGCASRPGVQTARSLPAAQTAVIGRTGIAAGTSGAGARAGAGAAGRAAAWLSPGLRGATRRPWLAFSGALRSPFIAGLAAVSVLLAARSAFMTPSADGPPAGGAGFMAMPGRDRAAELFRRGGPAAMSLTMVSEANRGGLGPAGEAGAAPEAAGAGARQDTAAKPADGPPPAAGQFDAADIARRLLAGAHGDKAAPRELHVVPALSAAPSASAPSAFGSFRPDGIQAAAAPAASPAPAIRPEAQGKAAAMTPAPGRRLQARRAGGGGARHANSLGQLRFAERMSQSATYRPDDNAHFQAAQAFDGTAVQEGGYPISGGGSSLGGAGASPHAGGQSGSGLGGGPNSSGGPLAGGPSGLEQQISQNCETNPALEGCRQDDPCANGAAAEGCGENATPWQKTADLANILLLVSAILVTLAYFIRKSQPQLSMVLSYVAAALAAAVAIIGIYMMIVYGQQLQGFIYTAVGGLLAYLAWSNAKEASAAHKAAEEKAKLLAKKSVPVAAEEPAMHSYSGSEGWARRSDYPRPLRRR